MSCIDPRPQLFNASQGEGGAAPKLRPQLDRMRAPADIVADLDSTSSGTRDVGWRSWSSSESTTKEVRGGQMLSMALIPSALQPSVLNTTSSALDMSWRSVLCQPFTKDSGKLAEVTLTAHLE